MISFIVPAYNEEHELPATLSALHRAASEAGRPYEIVVVDDDSTDATAAIALAANARVVPVRCRQIAAVRNAGARAARGGVFCFVDADTRIGAAHVAEALTALASGAAGGGARVRIDDEIPRWARVSVWIFAKLYFAANLGAGAFLFTTREFFERSGGFDEQYFAGEEIYFSKALKRLGKFNLLAEPVVTSGRKLRIYSGRDLFRQTAQIIFGGKHTVGSRDKLGVWYDGRRESPLAPAILPR
jgi:glycosyltransferase involved in cell wall biosynthesis